MWNEFSLHFLLVQQPLSSLRCTVLTSVVGSVLSTSVLGSVLSIECTVSTCLVERGRPGDVRTECDGLGAIVESGGLELSIEPCSRFLLAAGREGGHVAVGLSGQPNR